MIPFTSILKRIIFSSTIVFFVSLVISLVLFFAFSLEFIDSSVENDFYLFFTLLVPVAILLTMTGTIKKKNASIKNWRIAAFTISSSVLYLVMMYSLMFHIASGTWTNETVLYRHESNKNISINVQLWDVGALGYKGKRIVEIKPVLKYFANVNVVDTARLNKSEWVLINQEK